MFKDGQRYVHSCEQPSAPVLTHGHASLLWESYLLSSLHSVCSYQDRQEDPEQDGSCGQGCQSGDPQRAAQWDPQANRSIPLPTDTRGREQHVPAAGKK